MVIALEKINIVKLYIILIVGFRIYSNQNVYFFLPLVRNNLYFCILNFQVF